ncbi:mitochondrial inner membrane m-AAA protease component paraplegin-like [Tubulanus polymorphus]|uniref:mitochondrial inner membrane m-AAA protease component paraplegin-like n=1 Tax=Tubulanus polymorphus TaxID=672921 RepID=UPI003DA69179
MLSACKILQRSSGYRHSLYNQITTANVTSTRNLLASSSNSSSPQQQILQQNSFCSSHPSKKGPFFRLNDASKEFQRFYRVLATSPVLQKEGNALLRILQSSNLASNAQDLSRIFGLGSTYWFSTSKKHRKQQTDPRASQDRDDDKNDDDKNDRGKIPILPRMIFIGWVMFAIYTTLRVLTGEDTSSYRFVSWNEFVHDMLAKGEVEEIIIRPEAELAIICLSNGAVVKGRRAEFQTYTMKIPDPIKFETKVRKAEADLGIKPERGVPVSYQREGNWGPVIVLCLAALVAFIVFRNFVQIKLPNPTDMFASERKAKFVRVDQLTRQGKGTSFKDVAGLHEAKVEVMEFVDYLKHPQRFKDLGAKVPHGAILLGPPGCGKTLLARAVANEAHVPFLAMAGSEFVEMIGGLGAARVRDLFKEARKNAPCIVYVDEIDAIGRKRSGSNMQQGSGEEEHTLNQLLVEMDGMGTVDGVIMLASTNRGDVLDKALLRPGRFDRHINIDLPTLQERKETFEMYLKKLVLKEEPSLFSPRLAELSPGMSGADIANICNEAALHAARDSNKFVAWEDFDYAVERVIAGVAKKSKILSVDEKRIVAFHEAGHALVGWLLEHTDALLKISIVPRTNAALGFAQYMPSDKKLHSKEELFEKMCMALGGRVAESLIFNRVTTGAQNDLKRVTQLAYTQIRQYGMNNNIGPLSFDDDRSGSEFVKRPYSKKLMHLIDEEARSLVARAYKRTEQVLSENKHKLEKVAETLIKHEVLSYNDVEQLIGPPPFGPKKLIADPMEEMNAPTDSQKESPETNNKQQSVSQTNAKKKS